MKSRCPKISRKFFRRIFFQIRMDFQLEHLEMEFEAETSWFCSPHEYYKTTKFQLQTPSLSASTRYPPGYESGDLPKLLIPLPHSWYHSLKSVYRLFPISSQKELDLRTFETMPVQYVINENIFRIFVTFFVINFFEICSTSLSLNFQLTFT